MIGFGGFGFTGGRRAGGGAPTNTPLRVLVTGQSNAEGMFSAFSSPPAALAGTFFWDGAALTTVPATNGVRELANGLRTLTGREIRIAEAATSGAASNFFVPGQGGFDDISAKIIGLGGVDLVFVRHGEGDADGAPAQTPAGWKNNWTAVFNAIEAQAAKNVPMIFGSLATYGGNQATISNAEWAGIQQAIVELCNEHSRIHYSHSIMDATRIDVFHYDGVSYGKAGARFARSGAVVLGAASGHPAWFISRIDKANTTTTTVTVQHGLGTDFTPATGITGFEVSADNTTWISATGVRTNATTITLTHSAIGAASTDDRFVRYQFGTAPDITGAVFDNSALAVPLNLSAGQLLADLAVPLMTSAATISTPENQTYVMNLTASRPSSFTIGGTDGALFNIQNGDELHFVAAPNFEAPGDAGANNVYDITITPTASDNGDVGAAQSVAVTVTDISEGGGRAYSFLGAQVIGGTLNAQTVALDIGAAAPDRYILVGVGVQNADPDPTVTVGGVALTKISFDANTAAGVGFYGGLVTTGNGTQNIVISWTSAAFERKEMAAWRLTGLSSTTPKQIVPGIGSMPVDAGDLVFLVGYYVGGVGENLSDATEAPARSAVFDTQGFSADWTIAATNAAFNFGHDATTAGRVKVSFA